MTDILRVDSFRPSPDIIVAAALVLKAGGVVVFPTDTVYCVAADLENEDALRRLYDLKGRPETKGLPVLIPDKSRLNTIAASVPPELEILTDCYWPGALTVVFKKTNGVSPVATGGLSTVAVRLAGHTVCQAVLEEFGAPVATSSANLSGGIAPRRVEEIDEEILNGADLVIDGGVCPDGVPSTILDVSGPVWKILREGRVTRTAIETAVGRVVE